MFFLQCLYCIFFLHDSAGVILLIYLCVCLQGDKGVTGAMGVMGPPGRPGAIGPAGPPGPGEKDTYKKPIHIFFLHIKNLSRGSTHKITALYS